MADGSDKDKTFAPFNEEQRKLIEEKVQRAKEKLLRESAASDTNTPPSPITPDIENKQSDTARKTDPVPSELSASTKTKKSPATYVM